MSDTEILAALMVRVLKEIEFVSLSVADERGLIIDGHLYPISAEERKAILRVGPNEGTT